MEPRPPQKSQLNCTRPSVLTAFQSQTKEIMYVSMIYNLSYTNFSYFHYYLSV